MTRDEAIKLLRGGPEGIKQWNQLAWNIGVDIDLSGMDLSGITAKDLVFPPVLDLRGASFARSRLSKAQFNSCLNGVKFSHSHLHRCSFWNCDVSQADFTGATVHHANFFSGNLSKASFHEASFATNIFDGVDLSAVTGLGRVSHIAPSILSPSTLAKSRGRIPDRFLRRCGLKPWEIVATKLHDPTLAPVQIEKLLYRIFDIRAHSPIYLGGVFISYSRKDAKFVDRIHDVLLGKGANVWLDRHDMIAGPLRDQVRDAIGLNDTLLLVLSKTSVESDWVEYELDKAREKEKREGRSVLCPVALDDSWKAKMDDPLWRQVKKNNVLNFAKWRSKDVFDAELAKLIKGLKIYYPPKK